MENNKISIDVAILLPDAIETCIKAIGESDRNTGIISADFELFNDYGVLAKSQFIVL